MPMQNENIQSLSHIRRDWANERWRCWWWAKACILAQMKKIQHQRTTIWKIQLKIYSLDTSRDSSYSVGNFSHLNILRNPPLNIFFLFKVNLSTLISICALFIARALLVCQKIRSFRWDTRGITTLLRRKSYLFYSTKIQFAINQNWTHFHVKQHINLSVWL